ncbi:MAG: hypothetical protein D3924_00670 [Candidatus Electrothrix sp. AR4]|nr:hypothetical protein [Candidatus Electrothrix sp. AR4]
MIQKNNFFHLLILSFGSGSLFKNSVVPLRLQKLEHGWKVLKAFHLQIKDDLSRCVLFRRSSQFFLEIRPQS